MQSKQKVTLQKVINEFNLTPVVMPGDPCQLFIQSPDINRPGLQLAGFFDVFRPERTQVMGRSELTFMQTIDEQTRRERIDILMSLHPPAVVVTRNLEVPLIIVEAAQRHGVPLFTTGGQTGDFMATWIASLNVDLAPRITRHGVLMEVFGEGVLILGDSGIGKSETAVELIERGHRLIADDAVEIRRVSNKSLVGSSPENIRHFMELRGIGVINASRVFGMGAIKITEKIDMIIQLEIWQEGKFYDRLGTDSEVMEILGIRVPVVTIPVTAGRNLAVIIEVATMNFRCKKMGYHAARELMRGLGMPEDELPPVEKLIENNNWDAK